MAFGLDSVIVAAAVLMLILMNSSYLDVAKADSANDGVDECAQELVGMATCLPYVGGQSKAPTPDCCSGLKQVLDKNKKCLCVIIQDRNDPDLGLQINVTLALGLPSVCQAPANVSKCPELLHLDPKSPEAQVFYQLEKNTTRTATSPAPTPGAVVEGPASVGSSSSSGAASDNGHRLLRWNEMVLVIRSLSWCFTFVFLSLV